MDCKTAQRMVTPYIKRELADRELEEFVDHIHNCRECHEELEIYFTIHFALQKLDEEKNVSYDIHKMLKDDLRSSWHRVYRRKVIKIGSAVLMVLAEAALVFLLLNQSQSMRGLKLRETFLFEAFYGDAPEIREVEETETENDRISGDEAEEDERKDSTD